MTGLADRLRAGETLISGWTQLPEPLVAELVARQGFDAVAMDMQHGLHDMQSVMRSIGGVAYAGQAGHRPHCRSATMPPRAASSTSAPRR